MALRDWLQLSLTKGLGPILTARLVEAAGGGAAACATDRKRLTTIDGIGAAKASTLYDALRAAGEGVEAELSRCAERSITLLCREDADYPALLREIPDPPLVLYALGSLEPCDLNALAVVGSRLCSHYGREQAERFGGLLAGAGFTVVSGGARGIDSAAHRGAMQHPNGRTIAVLGCGVDVVYPPENESLFGQIAERGAIVSEFPLGTPPLRENFPRRNRIVSGLSRGVLVIEADLGSGALITARQACDDHGRPVFAIPGRIDNKLSTGPHALIRDGAVLTTGLGDIVENLGPLPEGVAAPLEAVVAPRTEPMEARSVSVELTERQRQILESMGSEEADVDAIIGRTDLAAEVVLQELTLMSLRGLVRRVDGQRYARRKVN